MSGSGGDNAPVNPRFSVRAAYVEEFWLELGDTPGRNEVWFPIQRTFGPVSIQQIGIRWIGGPDLKGAILLDGGVALAGLAVGVDDLSLTVPFADIGDLSKWELGLRGLAVSYDGGGVRIGGGLLQADLGDTDDVRYDGFLLVEVGGKSFVALGSYGVVAGDPRCSCSWSSASRSAGRRTSSSPGWPVVSATTAAWWCRPSKACRGSRWSRP